MSAADPKSENSSRLNRRAMLKGVAAATTLAASKSAKAQQQSSGGLVQIGKRTQTRDSSLKQQATMDYERSLAHHGGRLANPPRDLFLTAKKSKMEVPFAVVIIGSGYGASITAAKLSKHLRDDQRICILERTRLGRQEPKINFARRICMGTLRRNRFGDRDEWDMRDDWFGKIHEARIGDG